MWDEWLKLLQDFRRWECQFNTYTEHSEKFRSRNVGRSNSIAVAADPLTR
jgi:hypothetical protein